MQNTLALINILHDISKIYNKTCGILLSFVRWKKTFRSIILTLGVNELNFDSQHIFMV
jgi:hypothetical protein